MVGRHPFAVLNISISPEDVDVNVHPSKREIKLSHESLVYEAVFGAVQKTLSENQLIKEIRAEESRQDVLISKQNLQKQKNGNGSSAAAPAKHLIIREFYTYELHIRPADVKATAHKKACRDEVVAHSRTYKIAEGEADYSCTWQDGKLREILQHLHSNPPSAQPQVLVFKTVSLRH
jgi:DNA mismatch repair ATPase MutL